MTAGLDDSPPRSARGWRERLPRLGLRSRFMAVILLTTATTLAAVAVALLSPLERSLRQDELDALTTNAQAARGAFTSITAAGLEPGSLQLRAAALALARRAEARVAVVVAPHTVLVNGGDDPQLAATTLSALSRRGTVRRVVTENGVPIGFIAVRTRIAHHHAAIGLRRSLDEAHSAVGTVRRALALASSFALAVGLLLGSGLVTTVLSRIRRLRDAVNRVGAHGLETEVPPDASGDEVADLTRAFQEMQQALRRQEEARRAFVATASHELRTPITSLHGMLELLDEDLSHQNPDLGDARLQLHGARQQSARLVALARDLLDLSRLDAGSALRDEPVELVELSRAVLAEFAHRAAARPGSVSLEPLEPSCWAAADPGSVARIVRILIDNAMRYSPPDAPLRVLVSATGARPTIAVADGGPGVPHAEAERIFRRFERGRASGGDDAGFGLGLAIGRELARQMGGELSLAAPGGPGACFLLELRRPAPGAVEHGDEAAEPPARAGAAAGG